MTNKLIASRMRTPDGTVLQSFHTHDYKTHVDAVTGETYMLDGGISYQRTTVNKVPATDMSVYMNDVHELRRGAFCWGTRGRGGRQPVVFKPLKDLDTDHIQAILDTQHQISQEIRSLFTAELEYREQKL